MNFPKEKYIAIEYLARYGYERIGYTSSYGFVFKRKKENSVLKVYDKKDKAYTEYVKLW